MILLLKISAWKGFHTHLLAQLSKIKPDQTGCIWPDCLICDTGEGGASHTRRGAVYQGTCLVCGRSQKLGRYDGDSAYQRIHGDSGHKSSIVNGNIKNAYAKHIAEKRCFKFNVKSTHKSCIERQITEGCMIHNTEAVNIELIWQIFQGRGDLISAELLLFFRRQFPPKTFQNISVTLSFCHTKTSDMPF